MVAGWEVGGRIRAGSLRAHKEAQLVPALSGAACEKLGLGGGQGCQEQWGGRAPHLGNVVLDFSQGLRKASVTIKRGRVVGSVFWVRGLPHSCFHPDPSLRSDSSILLTEREAAQPLGPVTFLALPPLYRIPALKSSMQLGSLAELPSAISYYGPALVFSYMTQIKA